MSLRTGGREAVEDTPVTGATDEQIEAVCRRRFSSPRVYDRSAHLPSPTDSSITFHEHWMRQPVSENFDSLRDEATHWASVLVPVGYAIVRAEDALTAEQRAAIAGICAHSETMLRFLYQDGGYTLGECDELNQSFNRLRAIAAGGQG